MVPFSKPSPERVGHLTGRMFVYGFIGCELRLTRVARRSNKKVWRVSTDGKKPYCKWQRSLARLVEWLGDIRNIPVRIFGLA